MLKQAKKFGGASHITLPREYIDQMVEVTLPGEGNEYLTKKEIKELIEESNG